jgi:hypothetical protein
MNIAEKLTRWQPLDDDGFHALAQEMRTAPDFAESGNMLQETAHLDNDNYYPKLAAEKGFRNRVDYLCYLRRVKCHELLYRTTEVSPGTTHLELRWKGAYIREERDFGIRERYIQVKTGKARWNLSGTLPISTIDSLLQNR